jgi:hypothetical protein
VLLQAFDKVIPGSVTWRRVSKRPKAIDPDQPPPELSRFKAVENTNYAVDLAKANNMSMVGVQGADIVDANKTLTLGLVWQLMRKNVVQTLASLSKGGRDVTDSDIVRWANDTVKKAGKGSSMRSFKDPGIRNAVFWLDLLDAMKPGYVDYSLVLDGKTDEECKNNGALRRRPIAAGLTLSTSSLGHLDCEKDWSQCVLSRYLKAAITRRLSHLCGAGRSDRAPKPADHDLCGILDESAALSNRGMEMQGIQWTSCAGLLYMPEESMNGRLLDNAHRLARGCA